MIQTLYISVSYSLVNTFALEVYYYHCALNVISNYLAPRFNDSDSDSDRGLFNMKLHMEVSHQINNTNNTNILNKCEPDIIENACWETSTKIIIDRLRRGHPERGGVLRSVVGI